VQALLPDTEPADHELAGVEASTLRVAHLITPALDGHQQRPPGRSGRVNSLIHAACYSSTRWVNTERA
jgi:hypothetical protein